MVDKNRVKNLIFGLRELYDNTKLNEDFENTIQNTLIFLGEQIGINEQEVLMW